MSGDQASDAQGYRYVVREVPASGELDSGTAVAWAETFGDAIHYARMYGQDGPVTLWDGEDRIGQFGSGAAREPYQVRGDGRTVWVCDDEGMNRARFGRMGYDVHAPMSAQLATGKVCVACRRGRLSASDWADWCTLIAEDLRPGWATGSR